MRVLYLLILLICVGLSVTPLFAAPGASGCVFGGAPPGEG